MLLHQPRVLLGVEGEAALAGELLGELRREAVRRVQVENILGRELTFRRGFLELRHAALERLAEALLLGRKHAVDLRPVLDELGIRRPHLLDHHVCEAGQERRLHPDPQTMLHGTAHDAAQDVAAAFVRRRHTLDGDQRHPASVVGEDAVRLRRVLGRAIRDAGLLGDPVHDQLVAVGVVDRGDVLHDTRDALEPPAGVDVLARELGERAVAVELVRHEHEVSELEEALAARASRQAVVVATAGLLAPVPVHLRVRPARPRAADGPEVLRRRERHDPLRWHSEPLPVADRLLVGAELQAGIAGVHADPHAIPVELQALLDELGRVLDRALLEVLAEREIAEHLEERQVVRVEADRVDVDRSEDLLTRRRQRPRRRLKTEKVRHLWLHAGAGQQRRMIVRARDERCRGPPEMSLLLEEGEEALA